MKNNRKGFTLVELLAVIVILAILMVSAGAAVMSTLNNAKVNTFKNEALSAINVADNMYTEISMNPTDSSTYLKNSNDNNYKGMCVTLQGLVANGYLNKDLKEGAVRGVVLIEIPFDGGATKRTIWMTDGTYALTGIEQGKISSLRYNKANNGKLGSYWFGNAKSGTGASEKTSNVSGYRVGVVTDITKADQIIELAYGKKGTFNAGGTNIFSCAKTNTTNQTCTAAGADDTSAYKAGKNRVISKFYTTPENKEQGGTGLNYQNIVCINATINQ